MVNAFDYRSANPPLKCKLCGAVWDRISPIPCNHTAEQWESWRKQHDVPDGEVYSRWVAA